MCECVMERAKDGERERRKFVLMPTYLSVKLVLISKCVLCFGSLPEKNNIYEDHFSSSYCYMCISLSPDVNISTATFLIKTFKHGVFLLLLYRKGFTETQLLMLSLHNASVFCVWSCCYLQYNKMLFWEEYCCGTSGRETVGKS